MLIQDVGSGIEKSGSRMNILDNFLRAQIQF